MTVQRLLILMSLVLISAAVAWSQDDPEDMHNQSAPTCEQALESAILELARCRDELSGYKVHAVGAILATTNVLSGPEAEQQENLAVPSHGIIYQHDIDPNNTGILQEDLLRARLEQDYQDAEPTIVWLNWEGVWLERVRGRQGEYVQAKAIEEGRKAIDVSREVAPQHLYGYYQVPSGQYWGRDDAWIAEVDSYSALTGYVDVLGVSIYDSYGDARAVEAYRDDALYASDNARMGIYAARPHQTVWLWVMPRWHDAGSPFPDRQPSGIEYTRHIRAAVLADFDGRHIDGIVWWGHNYKLDPDHPDIPDGMSRDEYASLSHQHLLGLFHRAVTGKSDGEIPADPAVHPDDDWWQTITEEARQ